MFSVKAIQELFMESGTASENTKVRIITLSKNGVPGKVLFKGKMKELDKFEKEDNNCNAMGWIVNSIERAKEFDEFGELKPSYNSTIEIILV